MLASVSEENSSLRRVLSSSSLLRVALPTAAVLVAVAGVLGVRGGITDPGALSLGVIGLVFLGIAIACDLRWGIVAFALAVGASPEFPYLYHNLRAEDPIFAMVLLTWAARWVGRRQLPVVRSPIVIPSLVLLGVELVTTLRGVSTGLAPDPVFSWLMLAKRAEYLLIFWVAATSEMDAAWVRRTLFALFAGAAIAAVYGLIVPVDWGGESRVFAEKRVMGPYGENYNTFSGFLVLCVTVALGTFPLLTSRRERVGVGAAVCLCLLAILLSYSREGFIVLMAALAVFGVSRHRRVLLGTVVLLAVVLALAPPVRDNALYTFQLIQRSGVDDASRNSLTARYQSWAYRWNGWVVREPIMGSGVGCIDLSVDNELLLRAAESGLIGAAAFAGWLISVGAALMVARPLPGLPRCLAWGLGAGFVGLLVQSTVAVSFTTIRTMEPFWLLLGLLALLAAPQSNDPRKQDKCAS